MLEISTVDCFDIILSFLIGHYDEIVKPYTK